jgi:uncharacterized protein (TIGR02246 family)
VTDIAKLENSYSKAWSKADPEAIAAWHTDDSVFHLHNILPPFVGREAIAKAARQFFARSPDLRFDPVRSHFGDDHYVSEYIMCGTLRGRRFACDGTDVILIRDGLVARKDSYVDWLTYQAQTGVNPLGR